MSLQSRFSFGPWNIDEGSDPFGPPVRDVVDFARKIKYYRELGFSGVQFHDDDAVPHLDGMTAEQISAKAAQVKEVLDGEGLEAEFVAPRLWFSETTIDGAYTSNDPKARQYALERSRKAVDIARILDTRLIVLWLAREGTYIREAKDARKCIEYIVAAINALLRHDPEIRIAIEPKPNEPMDVAFVPTSGHAVAVAYMSEDPPRVGVNIESAHAILAGLDPSDEMGFALAHEKLFTVHLNDQNGLKFDQDKAFGSVDLRRAFNQVRMLERNDYGMRGEYIGLDVKAMRTQKAENAVQHLVNSRSTFLHLLDLVRSLDEEEVNRLIDARDYDTLDGLIVQHLLSS